MATSTDHRIEVEKLFDELCKIPPKEYCDECGAAMMHTNMTFSSQHGKTWTIPMAACPRCELKHEIG
jgi:hypothetical protein